MGEKRNLKILLGYGKVLLIAPIHASYLISMTKLCSTMIMIALNPIHECWCRLHSTAKINVPSSELSLEFFRCNGFLSLGTETHTCSIGKPIVLGLSPVAQQSSQKKLECSRRQIKQMSQLSKWLLRKLSGEANKEISC